VKRMSVVTRKGGNGRGGEREGKGCTVYICHDGEPERRSFDCDASKCPVLCIIFTQSHFASRRTKPAANLSPPAEYPEPCELSGLLRQSVGGTPHQWSKKECWRSIFDVASREKKVRLGQVNGSLGQAHIFLDHWLQSDARINLTRILDRMWRQRVVFLSRW